MTAISLSFALVATVFSPSAAPSRQPVAPAPALVSQAGYPPPPPPQAEAVPPPRAGWIWVPGFHEWRGRRYVWIPGRWELQGNYYVWIEGRWDSQPAPSTPVVREHP